MIKAELNDPKREDLLRWLDSHGIEYGRPKDDRARSIRGLSYFLDENEKEVRSPPERNRHHR